MADVTTPSAVAMSTMDAGVAAPVPKPHKTRPDKPDEAAYKEHLAKAEKMYLAAQETFVCICIIRGPRSPVKISTAHILIIVI